MAFDFSYMEKRESRTMDPTNEPIVKIWNHKGKENRKNSYFFLNKPAVALLNGAERVRVGIDVNTKKIVITPAKDSKGRQLSVGVGGSATISLKALIEENDLPGKTFRANYLTNYAHGGIIFYYGESEED